MELKYLSFQKCPTCQSRIVAEECRHFHCNGQGFERRIFECGCCLAWSPNFQNIEVITQCPQDPLEQLKKQQRRKANAQLVEFIDQLDVDDRWKIDAKARLQYLR